MSAVSTGPGYNYQLTFMTFAPSLLNINRHQTPAGQRVPCRHNSLQLSYIPTSKSLAYAANDLTVAPTLHSCQLQLYYMRHPLRGRIMHWLSIYPSILCALVTQKIAIRKKFKWGTKKSQKHK